MAIESTDGKKVKRFTLTPKRDISMTAISPCTTFVHIYDAKSKCKAQNAIVNYLPDTSQHLL